MLAHRVRTTAEDVSGKGEEERGVRVKKRGGKCLRLPERKEHGRP